MFESVNGRTHAHTHGRQLDWYTISSPCELKKRENVRGEGGCVQRMEVIVKRKKSTGGGGGQGRCERRSKVFVKIKKKKN